FRALATALAKLHASELRSPTQRISIVPVVSLVFRRNWDRATSVNTRGSSLRRVSCTRSCISACSICSFVRSVCRIRFWLSSASARSLNSSVFCKASAIRASASVLTASCRRLFARQSAQAKKAVTRPAITSQPRYAINIFRCVLPAISIDEGLDKSDWMIVMAITILFAGLSTIAALAIRDELRRFRAIQKEEREKQARDSVIRKRLVGKG